MKEVQWGEAGAGEVMGTKDNCAGGGPIEPALGDEGSEGASLDGVQGCLSEVAIG